MAGAFPHMVRSMIPHIQEAQRTRTEETKRIMSCQVMKTSMNKCKAHGGKKTQDTHRAKDESTLVEVNR